MSSKCLVGLKIWELSSPDETTGKFEFKILSGPCKMSTCILLWSQSARTREYSRPVISQVEVVKSITDHFTKCTITVKWWFYLIPPQTIFILSYSYFWVQFKRSYKRNHPVLFSIPIRLRKRSIYLIPFILFFVRRMPHNRNENRLNISPEIRFHKKGYNRQKKSSKIYSEMVNDRRLTPSSGCFAFAF